MDLGIAGRVCVITGGSRGIGLETARMLRAEDAKVLLVARDAGRLAAAAEGLEGGDEEIATLPLDITVDDAGEQMLGAALEAFGGVDVLVNAVCPAAVEAELWLEPGGLLDQAGAAWSVDAGPSG